MQEPEIYLAKSQIDPTLRAEALTVSQFCTLARIWTDYIV
jgi:16S rRNA A1518/A1519 N6-dimethyltransferase RsmA/KsgA/DIM1 with predicted DNA glycosylase/AP lyase activity